MEIIIQNCKNIRELRLDLEENKLNILIGASGCGKSTIKEALISSNIEDLKSLYTNQNPNIRINNVEPINSGFQFSVFDEKYRDNVLINRADNFDVYNIFFGDNLDFLNYSRKFDEVFADLISYSRELKEFKDKVEKVEREILKLKVSSNEMHGSSKLAKFQNKLVQLNPSQIRVIKNHSSEYYNWLKNGIPYIENDKCPFCKRKLSNSKNELVTIINSMNYNDFKIIENANPLIDDLGLVVPNYFKSQDVKRIKRELIEKIMIKNQVDFILDFINNYININQTNKHLIPKLTVSKIIYQQFSQLEVKLNALNQSTIDLSKQYNKCLNKLNKTIKASEKLLNEYLVIFGIPYEFKLDTFNSAEKVANYKLFHIKDSSHSERTFGLSYGEKNIISLLLFLIRTKNDYLIIDDPASSFDEFKRNSIYEMIVKMCKGKTTLLLSHDMVFGKFIAIDKKRNIRQDILGKLMFLENFDYSSCAIIKDVSFDDFGSLQYHLMEYLKDNFYNLDYISKIIILRLVFESNKKQAKYKIPYSYLSAILHRTPIADFQNALALIGKLEETVIESITNIVKEDFDFASFNIEIYDVNYVINNNIPIFIKLMLMREITTIKHVKKELSSIVHLNESQVVQINPLVFNYFSKRIYDFANEQV